MKPPYNIAYAFSVAGLTVVAIIVAILLGSALGLLHGCT